MADENTEWAVGSRVLGKFWNQENDPPVVFRVIHRTKHYATVQRVDDWSQVFRKRLQKQKGEWSVLIGPLWLCPACVTPSDPDPPSCEGGYTDAF